MTEAYHIPVMARRSVEWLVTDPNGIYVDATFGGGGHSRYILEQLGERGRLFALDQDKDAFSNDIDDHRFKLILGNFRFLKYYLKYEQLTQIHGILADLGVSSYQLDNMERGFSFQAGDLLDMRMNQKQQLTARDILNRESEQELVRIFSEYGEVRNAKTLARAVVKTRERKLFDYTQEFLMSLEPLILGNRSRYLAQVFQAIRIKVNDEVNALEDFLEAGNDMLIPGGRFVVLTYHSIEDRVVKNFFKYGSVTDADYLNQSSTIKPVFKKPLEADREEIRENIRARSAKLRVGEKTQNDEKRTNSK